MQLPTCAGFLTADEGQQQVRHLFGLFLLNPVPRSVRQMAAAHVDLRTVLHLLDSAGRSMDSSVTGFDGFLSHRPGNKHRGNITTMANLQLSVANSLSAASVPL